MILIALSTITIPINPNIDIDICYIRSITLSIVTA